MSPRTLTKPPTDSVMWRRLAARVHPDVGGDHDLFIWVSAVREMVCGDGLEGPGGMPYRTGRYRSGPAYNNGGRSYKTGADRIGAERQEESPRIPFGGSYPGEITARALRVAPDLEPPYGRLLRLLGDFAPAARGRGEAAAAKGATYRQLAAIAHAAGLDREERQEWYSTAEALELSQAHARHMLSKLKGPA